MTSAVRLEHRDALAPCAVGIDSLYLGSYLDGLGIDWERLRFEREKLRATPGANHVEIDFGGERFALKRGGRKPYSFILTNRNFELSLGENIQPRCHAQFRSELLWREGLDTAIARYDALWQTLGSHMLREHVVSRVDAAFDFVIGNPDFKLEDFVSLAKKDGSWREGGELQSAQFGKGDVVVRAYDKVAEIDQQSDKRWFFEIWGTKDGVWRFEFQIRGETLKDAGIATLDQMRAYLPNLVCDLARHHTSLRVPTDDSNRSRWPMHPIWRGVIEASSELTSPPDYPPPNLLVGNLYKLDRQLNSLLGDGKAIAATLCANSTRGPMTFEQFLNWLPRALRRRQSEELWLADVSEKMRKRGLRL